MGRKGGLFRYADGIDTLLLLFGTMGSIGDGLMSPLTMYVLSGVINDYGGSGVTFSNEIVNKYSLRLLFVAVGVGISAFIEGLCWTRTAERQTSRIRMEYLKSVLRQEVSFFENQAASSTTFQVISTISSDAHSIQDTIAEKIPNCLTHLTSFIFSIIFSFVLSWRLAVAALPFSLLFIVPGIVFGKVLMELGGKAKDAYGVAGGIAEQAISSIRNVYSYVGEHQTLDRFSHALQKSLKLGMKQGLTKGLLIGSMGMIYATWAFQAWAGSVLVIEKGEKGGFVFISGIFTILGGMAIMGALPNLSFISEATNAAMRIFEMIDRIPVINSEDEKGKILAHVRGEIQFKEENILFGKEDASMDLVVKAAKAANAHDFILKLTDGYETQVGQLGIQLSVLQSGKVTESGSHDELMQLNNREGGGIYSKMVQLQQSAMRNDQVSRSPYNQTLESNYRNLMKARTPPQIPRTSYQNSPADLFSPAFSITMTHSFQTPNYDNQNDNNLKNYSRSSSPPQLRLMRMSAIDWKRTLLGCLGAAGVGAVHPTYTYFLGSVVSVYLLEDNSKIESEIRFYCIMFLALTVLSFITNLLQHYNFAIMGERLVKRVREKMLGKVLSFEIGWFDHDENTSAAICGRLANEANMVRSLVADRTSLLIQVFFSASLAYTLGLLLTWRVAIIMIATQPLVIGCLYSRSVLMKGMSEKARKAQTEGSQLASEATINHRTITAFSSQNRILSLYRETMKGPKNESIKQSWFSGFGLFSSQFLTTATITLTYWYGGRLLNQGLISSKHLFQVFFILMSTGKNIADAGSMTSDLAKGVGAIKTIFAILDRETEIEPEEPEGIEVEKEQGSHSNLLALGNRGAYYSLIKLQGSHSPYR
ncbi:hypothetical protein QYF36_025838 [Acer negundo]|nr:hypothetical protein QYF36_025838 [Acer negundo]